MTPKEAIKAIDGNWPPERYTMLREALEMAKAALSAAPPAPQPAARCEPDEHEWEHDGSSGDWCTRCFVVRRDVDTTYAARLAAPAPTTPTPDADLEPMYRGQGLVKENGVMRPAAPAPTPTYPWPSGAEPWVNRAPVAASAPTPQLQITHCHQCGWRASLAAPAPTGAPADLVAIVQQAHARTIAMFGGTMARQAADYLAEVLLQAWHPAAPAPPPVEDP